MGVRIRVCARVSASVRQVCTPASSGRSQTPLPQLAPAAAYLHVSAEGGVGTKQDLALLAGTVVHPGQLVREAHRVLAPGVRDQQAGADFRPGTAKR